MCVVVLNTFLTKKVKSQQLFVVNLRLELLKKFFDAFAHSSKHADAMPSASSIHNFKQNH